MRRIRMILVVAAIAAAGAVALPGAAQAADGGPYAWEHVGYTGAYCQWSGNDGDWASCWPAGDMLNRASSFWNSGYPGGYDDVGGHTEPMRSECCCCTPTRRSARSGRRLRWGCA